MEVILASLHWTLCSSEMFGPLLLCLSFPFGMPPGPADPALARVAPADAVFYANWSGTATPDPNSKNRAERFLANPEIRHVQSEAFQRLAEKFGEDWGPGSPKSEEERSTVAQLKEGFSALAHALFTQPGACYLAAPESGSEAEKASIPRAALIFRLGEARDHAVRCLAQRGKLNAETKQAGEGEKLEYQEGFLRIAVRNDYLVVTVGGEAPDTLIERMAGPQPDWIATIAEQLPVERPSLMVRFNLPQLGRWVEQASKNENSSENPPGDQQKPDPVIADLIALSRQLGALTVVTGLDGEEFVAHAFLELEASTASPVAAATPQPLRTADLATIPADATVAFVARLDPNLLLQTLDSLQQTSPDYAQSEAKVFGSLGQDAAQASLRLIARFLTNFSWGWAILVNSAADEVTAPELQLAPNIYREILASAGDTWCGYSSPEEGVLLLTGATFSVSVREHDRLARALEQLAAWGEKPREELASAEADSQPKKDNDTTLTAKDKPDKEKKRALWAIRKSRFADHDIYYVVNSEATSLRAITTLCWCLTDRALLCSSSPQQLKACLLREANAPSLAEVPVVAEILRGPHPPTMLAYENAPELFRLTYPFLQSFVNVLGSINSLNDHHFDQLLLPAASTISKHLRPAVTTLQVTPKGVTLTTHQSLPGGNFGGTLWVAACAIVSKSLDQAAHEKNQNDGVSADDSTPQGAAK